MDAERLACVSTAIRKTFWFSASSITLEGTRHIHIGRQIQHLPRPYASDRGKELRCAVTGLRAARDVGLLLIRTAA